MPCGINNLHVDKGAFVCVVCAIECATAPFLKPKSLRFIICGRQYKNNYHLELNVSQCHSSISSLSVGSQLGRNIFAINLWIFLSKFISKEINELKVKKYPLYIL